MNAALLHEVLVLFGVWQDVVNYVSLEHPTAADPQSVFGAACAADRARLVARVFSNGHGDTLEDAYELVDEVLALAQTGHRPRYGREIGLVPELFKSGRPDA